MKKPWLVLVNGLLWRKHRTRLGADRKADSLIKLGKNNVSVAYEAYPERVGA